MPRWIHANLDFEYELRHGSTWTAPPTVRGYLERWRSILRVMPGWEEAGVADGPQDGEWLVWGWTDRLRRWASVQGPEAECVKRANSKLFSQAIANELGVGLPGEVQCGSLAELDDAVSGRVCLVKHPLGVSGRERVEVRGELDPRQRGFLERCLREGPIVVEPRVAVTREWCVQFDVNEDGIVHAGTAMLLTDAHGQHRGHVLGLGQPPADAVALATEAAWRAHGIGYRGALGVDGFEGSLDGQSVQRPISEINARMTFGRIAVELGHRASGPIAWWLPSERARPDVVVSPWGQGAVQYLPDEVDAGGQSGSLVLAGESEILRWLGGRHSL